MLLARAERDFNGGSAFGAISALEEVKIATPEKVTPKEEASRKDIKCSGQNATTEEQGISPEVASPDQTAAEDVPSITECLRT